MGTTLAPGPERESEREAVSLRVPRSTAERAEETVNIDGRQKAKAHLDRCLMLGKDATRSNGRRDRSAWRRRSSLDAASVVPEAEEVVVSSRGECRSIRRPLEPAHLLLVSTKGGDVVSRGPHVVVDDRTVPASRAQDVPVPIHARYPCRVALQPRANMSKKAGRMEGWKAERKRRGGQKKQA